MAINQEQSNLQIIIQLVSSVSALQRDIAHLQAELGEVQTTLVTVVNGLTQKEKETLRLVASRFLADQQHHVNYELPVRVAVISVSVLAVLELAYTLALHFLVG